VGREVRKGSSGVSEEEVSLHYLISRRGKGRLGKDRFKLGGASIRQSVMFSSLKA